MCRVSVCHEFAYEEFMDYVRVSPAMLGMVRDW